MSRPRRGPLPHIIPLGQKPQNDLPLFWRTFQDSCSVAVVEPPASYLEPTVPAAACQIKSVSIGTASPARLARRARSLRPPSTSHTVSAGLPTLCQGKRLLKRSWALAPKRMATRGGAHREEDNHPDGNKHGDTTKKNQDATLDHYVK